MLFGPGTPRRLVKQSVEPSDLRQRLSKILPEFLQKQFLIKEKEKEKELTFDIDLKPPKPKDILTPSSAGRNLRENRNLEGGKKEKVLTKHPHKKRKSNQMD